MDFGQAIFLSPSSEFQMWEVFTERGQKMEVVSVRIEIPGAANFILGGLANSKARPY